MTKVFLTGASGFIAKHILRELLEQGYQVRASISSDKRKSELQELFPDASLEYATLDLTEDDGWQDALQGCDVLMHTASPFPLTEPKDPQDLIRPGGRWHAPRDARSKGGGHKAGDPHILLRRNLQTGGQAEDAALG
jgi:dihydroflavonol-4-reductase